MPGKFDGSWPCDDQNLLLYLLLLYFRQGVIIVALNVSNSRFMKGEDWFMGLAKGKDFAVIVSVPQSEVFNVLKHDFVLSIMALID